jgi:hypothetical protein
MKINCSKQTLLGMAPTNQSARAEYVKRLAHVTFGDAFKAKGVSMGELYKKTYRPAKKSAFNL